MSIYSVRLAQGNVGPAGQVFYTAPSSSTIIVRDVQVYNGTASAVSGGLNILGSGSLSGQFAAVQNLASGGTETWQGRIVLLAGDVIESGFGVSGVYCIISGYSLE